MAVDAQPLASCYSEQVLREKLEGNVAFYLHLRFCTCLVHVNT